MTQDNALALLQRAISNFGIIRGCEVVASAMSAPDMPVAWQTVYAWHRRGNVPAWRVEAVERARPHIQETAQALGE